MLTFRAVACDYDGTLASHDHLAPGVVDALEQARAAGLRLVLVTGRTFFELSRVCERLDLFDGVVAENGGVLYFPADGALRAEGPPPPARLLAALDRRDVPFSVGHVIIAALERDRPAILDAMRETDVLVPVVSNRAALMLVPAHISKGSGLRTVLTALDISPRDVLALGDAENDLPLFDLCGWSACPGDAVAEVRERVDWVLEGSNGDAVSRAIKGPILAGTLPPPRSGRHEVPVGWQIGTSAPVGVPARGANALVQGDSLSGKSSFVGGLAERLAGAHDAVCVIDPEGDYHVLRELPSSVWVSVREPGAWTAVVRAFRHDPAAVVIADLTAMPHDAKVAAIGTGLQHLQALREARGVPHWIVLDEAHYSLHAGGVPEEAIGLDRKGFCLVTYRPSWLPRPIADAMDVLVVGRTQQPDELQFLTGMLERRGHNPDLVTGVVPDLSRGEFVLVRPGRAPIVFRAAPRAIAHVRHLGKYRHEPVVAAHRFVFRAPDGRLVATAGSLDEFHRVVADVDPGVFVAHAGRGDFSRWIRDVFKADGLAAQVAKLERRAARGEAESPGKALAGLLTTALGSDGDV
jgi:hypothetical protein